MFCGECGTKNDTTSTFCCECGAKLVQEQVNVNNNIPTNNANVAPKKPMSKKSKIIIAVVVAIAALLGVGYKVGSDMTSPKSVAKEFFEAMRNKDSDAIYKHLEIEGDKTFVSKKAFKKVMDKELDDDLSKIQNYKISEVTYSDDKLTAKVKISYTVEGYTTEKSETINLVKKEDKKLLFFDNWAIADLTAKSMVIEDYEITVDKDAKITYDGIKVADKYLDKEESNDTKDVYKLPQVFMASTDVVVKLSNGIKLEKEVNPSSYSKSKTITFDENNLSKEQQNDLKTKGQEVFNNIYGSIIAGKKFSEIKSQYQQKGVDIMNLETNYDTLANNLSKATNKLTSFEVATISIYDASLTSDGNIEVKFRVKYNYTISKTSSTGEETTYSDDDYNYMNIVFDLEKDKFYPVDMKNMVKYFSSY